MKCMQDGLLGALAFVVSSAALSCAGIASAQGANNCADAQFVKGYGAYPFNTAGATTDGVANALCLFSSQSNIFNDVWFRFVAPETFVVDVTNCGASALDSKIAIYDGSCAGPVIACSDDNCALQTRVTFATAAGSTYLIRVGSYSAASTGSGTITISPIALLGDVTDPATGVRYVATTATTWTAAEALGISLGGHLVSINDAAEQEFVWQNFRTLGGLDRRIWIGFSDQNVEGSFVWSDGSVAKYTNWNAGEPNNSGGTEDYAEMLGSSGKWNDLSNSGSGFPHIAVIELVGSGGGGGPCPADLDGDG
ncbi:MAG: C-type lectin domain-containing protein, partial [bacterium]